MRKQAQGKWLAQEYPTRMWTLTHISFLLVPVLHLTPRCSYVIVSEKTTFVIFAILQNLSTRVFPLPGDWHPTGWFRSYYQLCGLGKWLCLISLDFLTCKERRMRYYWGWGWKEDVHIESSVYSLDYYFFPLVFLVCRADSLLYLHPPILPTNYLLSPTAYWLIPNLDCILALYQALINKMWLSALGVWRQEWPYS